jgi:hypothetical protein
MKRHIFTLLILTHYFTAQTIVKGKIVNGKTGEAIPFAAIGLMKTGINTLSNETGFFELKVQEINVADSLSCYAIGFKQISLSSTALSKQKFIEIKLDEEGLQLDEIEVSAKKLYNKKLGIAKYNKRNCSGFIDLNNNWKGVETAIRLPNPDHRLYRVKDFAFYVIKNNISDTLSFRLNFYSSNQYYPTRNILKKSIIFKTTVKKGEVKIDLSDHNIVAYDDFYVSMECLMEKVSISDFCFAGEISEPSYVRESAFRKWKKVRGGGAAFNVTVLYAKS